MRVTMDVPISVPGEIVFQCVSGCWWGRRICLVSLATEAHKWSNRRHNPLLFLSWDDWGIVFGVLVCLFALRLINDF